MSSKLLALRQEQQVTSGPPGRPGRPSRCAPGLRGGDPHGISPRGRSTRRVVRSLSVVRSLTVVGGYEMQRQSSNGRCSARPTRTKISSSRADESLVVDEQEGGQACPSSGINARTEKPPRSREPASKVPPKIGEGLPVDVACRCFASPVPGSTPDGSGRLGAGCPSCVADRPNRPTTGNVAPCASLSLEAGS